MEKKVAIFDIDKTIIRIDSMFYFLLFGIKKKPSTIFHVFKVVLFTFLYQFKLIKIERAKEPYFQSIKYMNDADLKMFYETVLKPNLYELALEEMKKKKEEGCLILLVTASPYAYMKFFNEIPYVDIVIGTDLKKVDGHYINRISGNNCKGEEKVRRIQAYLQENDTAIDFSNSYAYSDSLSDRPMFSLVKHNFLINKKFSGLEDLTWN